VNGLFVVNRRADWTPTGAATYCVGTHDGRKHWSLLEPGSQLGGALSVSVIIAVMASKPYRA